MLRRMSPYSRRAGYLAVRISARACALTRRHLRKSHRSTYCARARAHRQTQLHIDVVWTFFLFGARTLMSLVANHAYMQSVMDYIVMVYVVMECMSMGYTIMAHIVMACIVTAHIVMEYIVMAYMVTSLYSVRMHTYRGQGVFGMFGRMCACCACRAAPLRCWAWGPGSLNPPTASV